MNGLTPPVTNGLCPYCNGPVEIRPTRQFFGVRSDGVPVVCPQICWCPACERGFSEQHIKWPILFPPPR